MTVIVGEFYKGQGLGNQLYVYASIRGIAEQCGKDYAFVGRERFKGAELFDLDFGVSEFEYPKSKYYEKRLVDPCCGHDIASVDVGLLRHATNAEEPLKVEGLLAGRGYWPGGLKFVREIFRLKPD